MMTSVPTPAAARYKAAGEPSPPAPIEGDPRAQEARLPGGADLGQDQVAGVAGALGRGQPALAVGGRDRSAGGAPGREAPGQRPHRAVAELGQAAGGQDRAHAAGAVDQDRLIAIGRQRLDPPLEEAARHRDRARDHPGVELVGLADVDDQPDGQIDRGRVDLDDLGPGPRDQLGVR
jgi:hypothetical protein